MNKCAIYMPVYNGAKFLRKTIDSVLYQTFKDFDLIILNDGSTDNSGDIIKSYLYDNRVHYINNNQNQGAGKAFFELFSKNKTYEYIAMLGQDDCLSRNYLESQITFLIKTNGLVSFSKVKYIDEKDNSVFIDMYHHNIIDEFPQSEIVHILMFQNHFCASASLINNKKLKNNKIYFGYNNDRLQDYELWLNLSIQGKFVYNKKTSVFYRWHSSNLSNPGKRIVQNKLEYYGILRRFLFSLELRDYSTQLKDQISFYERLVKCLVEKIKVYENPIILLIIDFCEMLFYDGYESEYLWNTLNKFYLQTGLIQKSLQNNPYKCILHPIFHNVSIQYKRKIISTGLFDTNYKRARDYDIKNIHIYINTESELTDEICFPAIVISRNRELCINNKNVLIVNSFINLKEKVIYFIQDFIFYYNNGLYNNENTYFVNTNVSNNKYTEILKNEITDKDETIECLVKELQDKKNQLDRVNNSTLWKIACYINRKK